MDERLTAEDFNHLLRYFEHTAFRLEVQPTYAVADERETVAEFLAGEPRPVTAFPFYAAWLDQIRTLTSQGKRVERVRILDEPPTDYQRWEIWSGAYNRDAGEVIRYVTRRRAIEVGLPDMDDWWLFDSLRLARMQFDELGHPLGGEIITDPRIVVQHCAWRDLAVHYSDSDQNHAAAQRRSVVR